MAEWNQRRGCFRPLDAGEAGARRLPRILHRMAGRRRHRAPRDGTSERDRLGGDVHHPGLSVLIDVGQRRPVCHGHPVTRSERRKAGAVGTSRHLDRRLGAASSSVDPSSGARLVQGAPVRAVVDGQEDTTGRLGANSAPSMDPALARPGQPLAADPPVVPTLVQLHPYHLTPSAVDSRLTAGPGRRSSRPLLVADARFRWSGYPPAPSSKHRSSLVEHRSPFVETPQLVSRNTADPRQQAMFLRQWQGVDDFPMPPALPAHRSRSKKGRGARTVRPRVGRVGGDRAAEALRSFRVAAWLTDSRPARRAVVPRSVNVDGG